MIRRHPTRPAWATTQGLPPEAALSLSHHRSAPEYAAPSMAFEIPLSSIPPPLEPSSTPQHPPRQPPTPQAPMSSTTVSPPQPTPPPAPPQTPERTSNRTTTTKMEANLNKILDNHLSQITATLQSSLHASTTPPQPPVPVPVSPQPAQPSTSHGVPPSRSRRTKTPDRPSRRSRSPRHSQHRSRHRRHHSRHQRPPHRHSRRSISPPNSASPPDLATPTGDLFFPSSRLSEGSTSDTDRESDTGTTYPIPDFQRSTGWLEEYKWASKGASRDRTASELPESHTWDIVETLSKHDQTELKRFQDEMYTALAKVHTTPNGSRLRIKVPEDIVINISGCFARARMLNLDLARRTESFFVEWPNRLLTVAVPTDFQVKLAWSTQGNSKYALYHKTEKNGQPSPRSSPKAWSAQPIGPRTTKGCLPNTHVMALLVCCRSRFSLRSSTTLRCEPTFKRFVQDWERPVERGDHRVLSVSSNDEASGRWQ